MRSRCSWKRENETDFSDCESFPINYSLLLILSIHKDEYFSRRLADRQLFRMVAVAYDKSLPIIERREKFQFGVVTLDLDSPTLGSAGSLALEAQKLLPRICIVGTKLDLVPQDYSEKDLFARGFKSYYAHFMRLSYFAVSSVTGAGIAEVCDFIGMLTFPALHIPIL